MTRFRRCAASGVLIPLALGSVALTAAGTLLALPTLSARAEELPPAVKELGAADASVRQAALERLRADPGVDRVLDAALNSDATRKALDERTLIALCGLVRERGKSFANFGLRHLLSDTDAPLEARRAAAVTLETTGNLADVSPLGDAVPELPAEAARALAAIGGPAAINALRRGGGERPGTPVQAALLKLGDDAALDALMTELDAAADPAGVTQWLSWATGRDLGSDVARWHAFARRRALETQLADPDADAATEALRDVVKRLADDTDGALADDLIAMMRGPDWDVFARNKAAMALGLAGVAKAKPALLESCANRQPGSLRVYAADALARMGDLSCAVPLASMLVHDEDVDRLVATREQQNNGVDYVPVDPAFVRTLFRLGLPGGNECIVELLTGRYRTRMHRDCMRALAELTGGDTFGYEPDSSDAERIAASTRIRNWWVAHREGLPLAPRADDPGWPAFRADVDALITKLGEFKFLYQLRAKRALVIVAEPALPQLLAALDNEKLAVRNGTAEVLALAGLRRSVPALLGRYPKEENPVARTKLLAALESCTGPRDASVPALDSSDLVQLAETCLAALEDRSIDVRIAAVRLLGNLPPDSALTGPVIAARNHPDNALDAFQVQSAGTLLRLGDRSALPDLVDALDVDDVASRAEALRLLLAGGVNPQGFDPDAAAEARAAAISKIRKNVPGAARR